MAKLSLNNIMMLFLWFTQKLSIKYKVNQKHNFMH
jgi:hypothetical protein